MTWPRLRGLVGPGGRKVCGEPAGRVGCRPSPGSGQMVGRYRRVGGGGGWSSQGCRGEGWPEREKAGPILCCYGGHRYSKSLLQTVNSRWKMEKECQQYIKKEEEEYLLRKHGVIFFFIVLL